MPRLPPLEHRPPALSRVPLKSAVSNPVSHAAVRRMPEPDSHRPDKPGTCRHEPARARSRRVKSVQIARRIRPRGKRGPDSQILIATSSRKPFGCSIAQPRDVARASFFRIGAASASPSNSRALPSSECIPRRSSLKSDSAGSHSSHLLQKTAEHRQRGVLAPDHVQSGQRPLI
jgi:hypothetical protein